MAKRLLLRSGPPKGVQTTLDPLDDNPSYLYDALNGYIPDPTSASGWYARPGFSLLNAGSPIYTSASPFRAQGGCSHYALDGTQYNFVVEGGHLFRVDQTLTIYTDVTPVGITISGAVNTRVQFASLAGQLVVNDGVNQPWIASNLSATPITGTKIDIDGSGTFWCARHITVYSGAIVALLNLVTLGGDVAPSFTIVWSAPGDPSLGYQQPNYDNVWSLEQTSSAPIYAIHGTNIGLYYFRQGSIGLATGALGRDFQTTHTDDAVADNVGSQTPQTIIGFSDRIFFTDAIGRPWMLPLGGAPVAIWQNIRAIIDASSTSYQTVTSLTSTAAFEPTLNLYLVAIWSPTPSALAPATQCYAWDAATGTYVGRMSITSATGGPTSLELLCTFFDNVGRATLMAFGSKDAAPAMGGYVWSFNALLGQPDQLTTEGGVFLTTEGDSQLTTEGQEEIWKDNGVVPNISVTTVRLGYDSDTVLNADQATVITGTISPVTITVGTTTVASVTEGTPVASASQDGTFRSVVGLNVQGRGLTVTVSPTTADEQWSYQAVSVIAVPSLAGPDDP